MLKSIKLHIVLIGLFLIKANACAQHHISIYEVNWSIWHPIAAFKVKRELPKAMVIYKEVKQSHVLDTLESGGKLDAFRHSFTMAYLARFVALSKLKKLGIAHEKGNYIEFKKRQTEFNERPDSLACEMDLRNNIFGLTVGSLHKYETLNELKELLINEIKKGNAWFLKRNNLNQYVDCSGTVLNLVDYSSKWFVPKCLIKTDE